MEIAFTEWVSVTDSSSVGEARRTALGVAQRLGFDESRSGELALLVTEVARNVLVHAGGGQVAMAGARSAQGPMARILALDHGKGIPDLQRAMADGYSTAGTPGGGLGAMKRIATALEIFSGKSGTVQIEHAKLRGAHEGACYDGETGPRGLCMHGYTLTLG